MDKRKVQLLPGLLPPIISDDLHIFDLMANHYPYEQGLVYSLDFQRGSIPVHSPNEMKKLANPSLKFEGMEKLDHRMHSACKFLASSLHHTGPVTCHLFVARPGSDSFPNHVDPDDVLLYVVMGEKDIRVNGVDYVLKKGNALFIPHGVEHQAFNIKGSIMLSFGLERYLMEKL